MNIFDGDKMTKGFLVILTYSFIFASLWSWNTHGENAFNGLIYIFSICIPLVSSEYRSNIVTFCKRFDLDQIFTAIVALTFHFILGFCLMTLAFSWFLIVMLVFSFIVIIVLGTDITLRFFN